MALSTIEGMRLCIIDSNSLAASKLADALQGCPSICIASCDRVLTEVETLGQEVSVFIIDEGTLRLPLSRLLRFLRVRLPSAKFVVVNEDRSQEEICQLLFLGAHGFVPYNHLDADLKNSVQKILEGHLWVPQEVLEKYVALSTQLSFLQIKQGKSVTKREGQIIELVLRRFSNKEIGTLLKIRESTVKFHLANIFEKVGVHDRHDLAEALQSTLAEVFI